MKPMRTSALSRWTTEDSAELYRIRNWGAGYFDIGSNGHIMVYPHGVQNNVSFDLHEIVNDVFSKGYSMPILLRFSDILESQIKLLNESFKKTIKEQKYKGSYRAVYPIKVNQKQLVVQDIMEFGRKYHHGLEAGSKAELIAAVANIRDRDSFVVCNGYKDEEFIDLALQALKMGVQMVIVIEMPDELPLIMQRSKHLGVKPLLGVRVKLSSRGGGHWESSGGDRSKFGLDASQIIELLDALRDAHMLDCLRMLHYHLGSQIPDIRRIRSGVQEACRIYVDLVREGAAMGMINTGGGLAVDYDGSHTNFDSSSNYTIQEYAADMVETIKKATDESKVAHPMIITESGRATIAHHSVLLFNVLDVRRFEAQKATLKVPDNCVQMLKNLAETRDALNPRNLQEIYHDAVYYRDEIRNMFLHGTASLRERALAESVFWQIVHRIYQLAQNRNYIPDEMEGLEAALADVYYCNFSLFQSLPDSWAVDHLFPIMPIHRLDEMPAHQGILADITCDSDGKIDTFIDLHDVKRTLPLHDVRDNEEYVMGVFLVGAYQETLGDMHNLLGTTHVIHVRANDDGEAIFVREVPGDSVEEVLSFVEYKPREVLRRIRMKAERAWEAGEIVTAEKNAIISAFSCGIQGYTYFEK